jgi:NAD(P)-dependent dehydrogenase (short-subunit alcohol dehydrogenase family)
MTQSDERDPQSSIQDVALIVGGGPGISSSCARLFAKSGMRVGIAARNPDKSVLQKLEKTHGARRYKCDASEPAAAELLFQNVVRDLGAPTLVVHNIDGRVPGIFGKEITEADPSMALETLRNSAFSAFLIGQKAAQLMRENKPNDNGTKGTIIFTNDMMRRDGEGWRISDIYLDGAISEVATRRSEFAAILKNDGIDGLIAALNRKADILTATTAKAS